MRYIIKEKIFTFADRFNIEDENGYPQYEVVGKIFSLGNKLRIYDLNGQELIYIEQEVFRFLPEYNIYKEESLIGKIKKEFTFFKPKFQIESSYGNFTVEGDVFHHDFNILKNGNPIAWINKKWVSFSDTYSVDILDEEDQPFILSIIIVLDQIFYDGNRSNS
ncbi:LURP-one-related/scramblase family protein [Schnuerera sp.]|uniref:LURP-one-related/scramblase family protein n=1 Tax=Schnuerera sp. TaxID=2794844 RepID=UPI002CCBF2B0|nr:LURP-one-related family protein [Schnuerera sp.]HSH35224.1 LURP-one-related family protein [Schnuerera sp.]